MRHAASALRAIVLCLAGAACGTEARNGSEEDDMPPTDRGDAAVDPKTLYRTSLDRAKSADPADLDALRRTLTDPKALATLDSDEAYAGDQERLRVAGVLQALTENASAPARGTLLALTKDPVFPAHRSRAELLIRTLADVRPAPPEAVAYWERFCVPDDGYTNLTIRAAIANGSPPAIPVFEKALVDPAYEEDRESWLLFDVLTHRNDLPLLEACDRLLAGGLDVPTKHRLVDVLFDYQPDEWYGPHLIPKPPPREQATVEALRRLRSVGETARKVPRLTARARRQVDLVLEEIEPRIRGK